MHAPSRLYRHSRQETREGQQRPIHRDYYYVDMHVAIDAIKYRVWHLTQKVKDLYRPSEEKKDYYCPRCQAKWTQLEVLDYVDHARGVFLCHKCDGPLSRDEVSAADRAGHERQSKLMAQLDHLLKLLQQIDAETIPQNDFATALSHQVPVKRDPTIHPPSMPFVPVKAEANATTTAAARPAAVVSASDLNVQVLTKHASDEVSRQEKERKAAQEQQNVLPVWHTQSTVKPGQAALKPDPSAANGASTATPPATSSTLVPKREDDGDEAKPAKPSVDSSFDPLAAYYAEMQQERLREAAAQDSSEEEEGDVDDGFEDVAIGASVHTPSSSVSGSGTPAAGAAKRAGDSDGADASTSGTGTPAAGGDRDGESPAKRARLDPGAAAKPSPKEEGESDEDEFEDAL